MTTTVGVLRLGAMGRPIAGHLVDGGLQVVVFDLDREAVEAVASSGARAAGSPAELAAASDVMLVLVASDDQVLAVCLGADGLLAHARRGGVLVISSSVRPETCEEVAAAAGPAGVDVLDAALTGGARGAEAGRVNLLVGGDEEVLTRIRPALAP